MWINILRSAESYGDRLMNWLQLLWWRTHVDPIALFRQDRSRLQDAFFAAASSSGKPRGLRWTQCQWNEQIEFVRDRATQQLHAFAGVTISFEAIEGGDMEGVEAVGNLRTASAVFFFEKKVWRTVGRAIFNLNPDEAVEHFKTGYERVEVKEVRANEAQ
jgi:hypothetical protein